MPPGSRSTASPTPRIRPLTRAGRSCSEPRAPHQEDDAPRGMHVAGYNLGLIMRLLVGAGTPREFLARAAAHLLALATADGAVLVVLAVATGTEAAMLVVSFRPEPPG